MCKLRLPLCQTVSVGNERCNKWARISWDHFYQFFLSCWVVCLFWGGRVLFLLLSGLLDNGHIWKLLLVSLHLPAIGTLPLCCDNSVASPPVEIAASGKTVWFII